MLMFVLADLDLFTQLQEECEGLQRKGGQSTSCGSRGGQEGSRLISRHEDTAERKGGSYICGLNEVSKFYYFWKSILHRFQFCMTSSSNRIKTVKFQRKSSSRNARYLFWPLISSSIRHRTISQPSRSLTCSTRTRAAPSTSMSSCWSRWTKTQINQD